MQFRASSISGVQVTSTLITRLMLVFITSVACVVYVWGIRQDLPYIPSVDEPHMVRRTVGMNVTGDLNPYWFGSPGSTILYPLATIYHFWNVLANGGPVFRPDPGLQAVFDANPSLFFLLGRSLTIAYALLSIPLIYLIGRRVFGQPVALIGTWFAVLSPVTVRYAQTLRTDSAGMFFALLAILLCLRLYKQPTMKNRVMAGVVIGLAIATRYFMVVLVPVLLAVELLAWRQREVRWYRRRQFWVGMCLSMVAIGAAFAVSTPFFFADPRETYQSIKFEARSENSGADGLSFGGNLLWYLTSVLPFTLSWPVTLLAVLGVGLAVRKQRRQQYVLLGFCVLFLVGISASSLHWQRWLIPIIPLVALFAAVGLLFCYRHICRRLQLSGVARPLALFSIVVVLSIWPSYQLVLLSLEQSNYSTRVLAREWILSNLPAGSRIAQEKNGAALSPANFTEFGYNRITNIAGDTQLTVLDRRTLAQKHTLDDYRQEGYEYLVVSDVMYKPFISDPERYPSESQFYQRLFSEGELLQEFQPSLEHGGPLIRVYHLPR